MVRVGFNPTSYDINDVNYHGRHELLGQSIRTWHKAKRFKSGDRLTMISI
ncbi:hypothetical protein VAE122_2980284 [Vibrio aestuarianus]|nr:hypothetical protein VAEU17_300031 [Vibrio aestuarianus]CAH8222542.1 hypothetical protein VAE122_2980284 [Vibrio aestuarianus]